MLSRDAAVVLLFIYAANDVNIGAELATKAIINDSIKLGEVLDKLRVEGLVTDIRERATKNKINPEKKECRKI